MKYINCCLIIMSVLSFSLIGCSKQQIVNHGFADTLSWEAVGQEVITLSSAEAISWEIISGETAHPLTKFDAMGGVAKWADTVFVIGGNGTLWNGDYAKWELWKGTSMDNLQKAADPTFKEPFPYYRTKGNDWHYYWAMGLWIDPDDGHFYTIAYSEYDFMNGWVTEAKERRLGLAKSIDQGKTWSYEGDIITQAKSVPAPAGKEYNGAGDISFFIADDGYAYIYYKVGFYNYITMQRTDQDICVARSPISAKLAPGSWEKFYNGSWGEPGLGGLEEVLFPSTSIVTVSYNSFLNKFVLIGNSLTGNAFISFADDMSNQAWSPKDFSFPNITSWYLWQVNPTTNDQFTMGETFRLYTTGVENDERVGSYHNVKFKID